MKDATRTFDGSLRKLTQARIGLGRAGQSMPTQSLLAFDISYAEAHDAVKTRLDVERLKAALGDTEVLYVRSRAIDRATYIKRPDLGRLLHEEDMAALPRGHYDAAFIIADGLSASAVHSHAIPLIKALRTLLSGWSLAPIVIASEARVALSDDVGEALGADLSLILLGERPGLSAPDSLGAYLTWQPKRGRRDSERNCVSNIRPPHGLDYAAAATRIAWLMREARTCGITGIGLKEDAAQCYLGSAAG